MDNKVLTPADGMLTHSTHMLTSAYGADVSSLSTDTNMLTSAYGRLSDDVRGWIDRSNGYFYARDMFRDLLIDSRKAKNACYQLFERMIKAGELRRKAGVDGVYRRVIRESDDIDWKTANADAVIQLSWPFHLERYVNLYPKNIAVVAGSPDAGKTALLLNVVYLNQHLHDVVYFNSEMGEVELKNRLMKFPCDINDWNFKCKSRSGNWADGIFPDAINIIDYYEISEDFSSIAQGFKDIFDALDKGVAIIALQKSRSKKDIKGKEHQTDLGRGAEFSLEKPRLYLAMDSGRLKIVKGKNWANTMVNPNNKEFYFKLVGGHEFIEIDAPTGQGNWWAK